MKSTAGLLAALLPALLGAAPPVTFDWFEYTGRDDIFAAPLPAGQYHNPVLAGFYPDPSICRVGDDFYLINSTFAYFPGIPVFHSRDLVNWTQLGHAIDRPTQLNYDGLGVTRGLFAPTISHHNGIFYVLCTMVDGGGNFLLTAKDPAGPWSDPVWLGFDGIDPSLFFDDDGRAWLVNNGNPPDNRPLYQGHRAIWLQEFDIAAQKLTGPRSIIVNGGVDLAKQPVWIEGPHLYKRAGWYYLCCAEGGTSDNHSQVILRSQSVTGPFVPWEKNPILTQRDLDSTAPHAVTCTGHADLVEGPGGQWWSVFLGCRPFNGKYTTAGRETFLLPVTWTDDGWPQILPPGERVPSIVAAPGGARTPLRAETAAKGLAALPPTPLTGNFTWRDDFTAPTLSPLWIMLRQPHETWWSLSQSAGKLSLTPRPVALNDKANPSFLARRLQHAKFTVTTCIDVPAKPGVSAGVALLQNETHHYFFAAHRTAQSLELCLEVADGATPVVLKRTMITDGTQLRLRVTGDEGVLAFAYATTDGAWHTLVSDAETRPITVQAAGGGLHFTGAVVGPFARLDP